MVDQQVIRKRLEKMEQSLRKVDRFRDLTWEAFNEDDLVQDVVEYNLLIAIKNTYQRSSMSCSAA